MQAVTRRRFLNESAILGAATVGVLAPKASVLGANEKIRVALIGSGGMGRGDLATFLKNPQVDCPVVCDVDDAMIGKTVEMVQKLRNSTPETVKDYRRIIDRKDVDACIVATPDHWHALPTIAACQAGKDVYVEKPLATSIVEGRAMVKAARQHQRVVQMGTQWRSGKHYQDAVAYVQSGKLGKIRIVHVWACLTWFHGAGNPPDGPVPAGVDYDLWLGPAPKRPFNPARFHFNFRWFWDYAGGLMTDWGVHLINIVQWAMQVQAPLSVAATGGKYALTDIGETPDTQCAFFEFPGFTMIWEHQAAGNHGVRRKEHGVAFDGANGTVAIDTAGWEVIPVPGKGLEAQKFPASKDDSRLTHVQNFLDCMRTRQRPVTDVEIGHYATATPHLGNVALLSGRKIRWDATKEEVIGDSQANAFVGKDYRKPWVLPT